MGLCAAASHFSFSFFAWLPAAPKYPPIIYRLKFLIFGFPFPLSFSRLPAGGPNLPSYSIPPQISDFWFSSLFLSLSFGRLPAGSPRSPPILYRLKFLIFGFPLSFFPSLLAACRPEVPQYPPIIYRLKFLIFGFALSLSFGFWPAAGWRSQTPLLFYTASNF